MAKRALRRGNAAIEFALTVPIQLMLVGGGLNYVWYFSLIQHVQNATEDGLRASARTKCDVSGATTYTVGWKRAKAVLTDYGLQTGWHGAASIATADTNASLGWYFNFSATALYTPLVGYVPHPANLTAGGSMMLELVDTAHCTTGSWTW